MTKKPVQQTVKKPIKKVVKDSKGKWEKTGEIKYDGKTAITYKVTPPRHLQKGLREVIALQNAIKERQKNRTILQEANDLIYGDRAASYGSATDNMGNTAVIWSVILSKKLKEPITAEEAGWMMVALKMAREVFKKSKDNLLDAAGYIGVIDKIQHGE